MDSSASRLTGIDVKLNQMGMIDADSPVSFLLDRIRPNRGQEKIFVIGLLAVLALCTLATAYFGSAQSAVALFCSMLPACYWFYAFWTLVVFPLLFCWSYANLHHSLLLKERYEDLLGSGLTSKQLVDQITVHTLRRCCLDLGWPVLRLGCALIVCVLLGSSPSAKTLVWHLKYSLYLLGASVAFLLPFTYLCQHWSVLMHFQRNLTSFCQVACLTLMGGGIYLAFDSSRPLFTLCVGWLCAVLVFRRLAIWVSQAVPRLKQLSGTQRRLLRFSSNPWIFSWSENPVIYRERARHSRQVPFGPFGAVLFDIPIAALFWFGIVAVGLSNESYRYVLFWALSIAVIQVARAARNSSLATVSEVEHRTLEATSLTSLTASVFQRGWLELVALPLIVENTLVFLGLVLMSLTGRQFTGETSLDLGIACLTLMLAPVLGAIFGFYASCAANLESQKAKCSSLSGAFVTLFVLSLLALAIGPAVGVSLFCLSLLVGAGQCYFQARRFLEGTSR